MKFTVFLASLMLLTQAMFGFDGFYVGGSVGAGGAVETQEGGTTASYTVFPEILTRDLGADSFAGHGDGSLFLGYGLACNKVYLGLEGFVRYSNPSKTIFNQTGVSSIIQREDVRVNTHMAVGPWHYGLDARFGWFFNPCTLVYGRFGAEWTKIDFESNGTFDGSIPSFDAWDLSLPLSQNKRDAFFRFGGGIEQRVTRCLSFRLDYVYTDYRNFDVLGFATTDTTQGQVSMQENNHAHLADHALTLGVSYFFSKWQPNLDACCFCPTYAGFYAFGAVGGTLFNASSKGNPRAVFQQGQSNVIFPTSPSPFFVDRAFLGLGGLGYGYCLKCVYLGVEVFAQYAELSRDRTLLNNYEQPNSSFLENRKVKTRTEVDPWQFGVQLRPGYFLTPNTLVFATVGTSYAKIRASSEWNGFFSLVASAPLTLLLNSSGYKDVATLRVGGGVEYAISSCWHLRADYIYTDYGTLRLNGSSSGALTSANARLIEASRFDLHTHALTVGVVKYF